MAMILLLCAYCALTEALRTAAGSIALLEDHSHRTSALGEKGVRRLLYINATFKQEGMVSCGRHL